MPGHGSTVGLSQIHCLIGDAERYENETSAFEKKYPELWAQKKERKPRGVKLRTKPKAAKTAWRVFLEECVSKAIEEGNISEDAKGLQKQVCLNN